MYIPDPRKTDYENTILKKLFILDIKHRKTLPSLVEDLKIFQRADQPFIDQVFYNNKLVLIWDHQQQKEIEIFQNR